MWNVKVRVIPVVSGVLGRVPNRLEMRMELKI